MAAMPRSFLADNIATALTRAERERDGLGRWPTMTRLTAIAKKAKCDVWALLVATHRVLPELDAELKPTGRLANVDDPNARVLGDDVEAFGVLSVWPCSATVYNRAGQLVKPDRFKAAAMTHILHRKRKIPLPEVPSDV